MNVANFRLYFFAIILMGLTFSCKRNESVNADGSTAGRSTEINNVKTFDGILLNINKQSTTGNFKLPDDLSNVKRIMMYVRLDCVDGDCPSWDVYANVLVKNKGDNQFYEMARYVTPYRKSNAQLARGFAYDVTDFKSLLNGNAELKIFAEIWEAKNWKISVEFDYELGKPDYAYYSIAPIMQYNGSSLGGIPYGVANDFKVKFDLTVPSNAEQTSFRTIISGWGHADNRLPNGNCAEWCPRTHHILLDGIQTIQHEMGLMECEKNIIDNQAGTWSLRRAGWCPGMEVPTRIDILPDARAGKKFTFEYKLQPWTNTLNSNAENKNAYYAISSFVVIKSNTPITSGLIVQ